MLLLAGASAAAAQSLGLKRPNWYLRGEPSSSGVSGVPSAPRNRFTLGGISAKRGIYGIMLGERHDHPCFVKVHRESVADTSTDFERHLDLCGDNGPTDRSLAWLGWTDGVGDIAGFDASRLFVRGIEVCLNNEKVKGLRLYSTNVLADGTLEQPPSEPELFSPVSYAGIRVGGGNATATVTPEIARLTRPHCHATGWSVPRFCGDGQIGVAIVAHAAPGSPPRDIRGLELLCRELRFGTVAGELRNEIIRPRPR